MKKISLIIITILILALTGCSELRLAPPLDKSVLFLVDSVECSTNEAVFRLLEEKKYYQADSDEIFWFRAVGDITFEEYIKDSIKEELLRCAASVILADDMNLFLTEEQEASALAKAADAYNDIKNTYNTDAYGITLEDVENLYIKKAIYNMVYDKLSADVEMEISEADTKVIKVNYVLLPGTLSLNEVEAIRTDIKSGTSLATAVQAYEVTPVMSRVLKKGEMPEEFEKAAYALLDGELSEIIESKDGKYLIQCVEDYMVTESVANRNLIYSSARKEKFDKAYREFAEKSLLRFNSDVWDRIKVSELGTE
ncbi:MAG: peptidylprolyl isomerase [Parasporobacterium sp.]|nr:peptidylprolyl isomerase [Parasporobacterium sp.]